MLQAYRSQGSVMDTHLSRLISQIAPIGVPSTCLLRLTEHLRLHTSAGLEVRRDESLPHFLSRFPDLFSLVSS